MVDIKSLVLAIFKVPVRHPSRDVKTEKDKEEDSRSESISRRKA